MTSKTHVNTYGGSVFRILEAGRSPDAPVLRILEAGRSPDAPVLRILEAGRSPDAEEEEEENEE
jgi:hypothetical protein